jgi:hypothetical protein
MDLGIAKFWLDFRGGSLSRMLWLFEWTSGCTQMLDRDLASLFMAYLLSDLGSIGFSLILLGLSDATELTALASSLFICLQVSGFGNLFRGIEKAPLISGSESVDY